MRNIYYSTVGMDGYNEYALYFRARRMALNIASLRQLLKRRRGLMTDEAGGATPGFSA